ncbi:hypothetical protein MJO28_011861 [Puccinia striiformis f. sp. tritici]|uniref:Secreted protein n=4 Tax=Puccinia striiformis TaxID=27350 RepID=A0A0L0W041_9BASI|nr:hypothetical protein Pst134EA_021431 [Puccinia striiformis f. sp. tritici]KAI9617565.1 hypothetical protein H4Q26_012863 [Puccinia striiformis f. sp. tritici PST-130]KNF04837.1 hypothetical protein PSTG_01892 [Puccinia striiformis f. sp. tritici PST-78]POV97482.1 hypothetical protein PSHT_14551 [Puccinia striiformis]KAH9448316.1 hypothetical protein Pst134EB_022301 [Puccinia striiformis f. sp. tritici]KAH9457558.1 hypothetical protein Pst134EA_021431 [Puccinia striiformis f. sp. tritici]
MHLASLVLLSLSVTFAQADSAQPNAAMAGPQPKLVAMKCDNIYLPLSPFDIAEMQSKGSIDPSQRAKLSKDPAEAVCKGSAAGNKGGMCDFKTCSGKPAVCGTCFPVTMKEGKLVKSSETSVEKVECGKNYFLKTEKDHNVCTASDNKMYSCTGECTASIECQSCVSMDDPAFQKTS